MHGGEYIRVARQLEGNSDEASKRAAISRAYYGAFIVAKLYAAGHGKILPLRDSHKALENIYKHAKVKEVSGRLKKMKDYRVMADYDEFFVPQHKRGKPGISNTDMVELVNAVKYTIKAAEAVETHIKTKQPIL